MGENTNFRGKNINFYSFSLPSLRKSVVFFSRLHLPLHSHDQLNDKVKCWKIYILGETSMSLIQVLQVLIPPLYIQADRKHVIVGQKPTAN